MDDKFHDYTIKEHKLTQEQPVIIGQFKTVEQRIFHAHNSLLCTLKGILEVQRSNPLLDDSLFQPETTAAHQFSIFTVSLATGVSSPLLDVFCTVTDGRISELSTSISGSPQPSAPDMSRFSEQVQAESFGLVDSYRANFPEIDVNDVLNHWSEQYGNLKAVENSAEMDLITPSMYAVYSVHSINNAPLADACAVTVLDAEGVSYHPLPSIRDRSYFSAIDSQ